MGAELGFWFLYSLFPFMIFLLAVSSLIPFAPSPREALRALERVVPDSFFHFLAPIAEQVLIKPHGWLAAGTLVLALWSASAAVYSLISTLDELYEVKETRPLWRSTLLAMTLTVTLAFIYIVTFTLLVLRPVVSRLIIEGIGLAGPIKEFFTVASVLVVALTMFAGFFLIYAAAPNAKWHWKTVLPGAIFTTAAFYAVSAGFSFYLKHFAYFGRFYGALGTVIALMTWFYLVGLIILIGGLLDGEIRHIILAKEEEHDPDRDRSAS